MTKNPEEINCIDCDNSADGVCTSCGYPLCNPCKEAGEGICSECHNQWFKDFDNLDDSESNEVENVQEE
jgi:hypothetical protein